MNKRAEFIHLIDSLKPDFIVGTETWLSDLIKNSEIIPDNMNFTIYRRDREDSYGGVMIAISKINAFLLFAYKIYKLLVKSTGS